MPSTTNVNSKVIAGLLFLVVVVGAIFYYTYNKKLDNPGANPKIVEDTNSSKDIFKAALERNSYLKEARDTYKAGDYEKTLVLSKSAFDSTSDMGQKSMAEFYMADSYLALKRIPEATGKYISIYDNYNYAKVTRATALNTIMQQYNGTKNKDFLKVIIPDPSKLNDEQIKDVVYEKIYEVYPLGGASAYIGIKRLSKIDQKEKDMGPAKEIYLRFLDDINKDIELQTRGEGSAYIVPNIMMSKAKFMSYAYVRFNFSSVTEISEVYEKAASLARSNNSTITEQFAYLNYINFLALQSENQKAEKVFMIFSEQEPTEMVLQNLKQDNLAMNWPGIAMLAKKSTEVKSYLNKYKISFN